MSLRDSLLPVETPHASAAIQQANGYRALLEYSRLWGNFTGRPKITRY